jgi:hypothetical protein
MAGHRRVYCLSALDVASHFFPTERLASIRDAIREDFEIIGTFRRPFDAARPTWKIFRRG